MKDLIEVWSAPRISCAVGPSTHRWCMWEMWTEPMEPMTRIEIEREQCYMYTLKEDIYSTSIHLRMEKSLHKL